MLISRKVVTIKEPLDINLQLMAAELDTSVNDMRYLSKDIFTDAITVDCFDKLCEDIENGEGFEITSFDDNTILYEYMGESVIVHNVLGIKYVLFDCILMMKIENKMKGMRH